MAMKFLTLEEAAQKLGVSEDALNQLRERHEAHGYRDGSSWKFKVEEIERLASEGLAEMTDSSDSGELMDFDMDDDGDDMVLLSEAELGESDPSTSSTIIGKPGSVQDPSESDVRVLAGDESGSDVKLVPDADASVSDSGVKLAAAVPETPPETPKEPDVGESGLSLDDDSLELDLDFGSGVPLVSDDSPTDQVANVELSVDDDDAVSLAGEYGISNDSDDDDSGGDINLGGENDDEFVLRGGGSDITMGAGDSGISLADPADSGLSLADPLDLGSSSGGEMLDLGGDDGSSDFELSSDSDSEALSEVGSDDDFLLTPAEDLGDADSEESGSQVIALDESDDFGASAAMLDEAGGDMVSMVDDGEESVDFSESTSTSTYAGAATMQPRGPEARFSTWDVVGLGACSLLLVLCGMVMFDLMRNMWSWQGTYTANGMVMDFVLGLFE